MKRILRKIFAFFLLLFSLFCLTYCAGEEITDQTVVASVGQHTVTAHDFRIAFELAPPGEKKSSGSLLARKREFLQKLVEKKLFTAAGLERHLDKDKDVARFLGWHEKKAVIREFFRLTISDKVVVSEEEMRNAYVFLNERLFLRQFLFQTSEEANTIYQRLQNGEAFEKIAVELAKSEAALKRTIYPQEFKWGDLDERLETAAYGLNHLETSAPIKSSAGFHLIQLMDRKENLMLTESGFQERGHYIETIIRRRKENTLGKEYIKTLMVDKRLQANGPVLLELTGRARSIVARKQQESPVPLFAQFRLIEPQLHDLLPQTLIAFEDGLWTVGDFFKELAEIPPGSRPDLTDPGQLQVELALMVRDNYLAAAGYQRRLEKSEIVQKEMKRIREEVVARRMKQIVLDSIQVSDSEIKEYFTNNIDRYKTPAMVNIREIMVREKPLADSLFQIVRAGGNFAELARTYSVRKWAAKNDGELGYFSEAAFGSISKKAFALKIGELSQPVPVKLDTFTIGYSIFRLLDHKPTIIPELEDVYNQTADDALALKKERVLVNFLANVKQDHPVKQYDAVLPSIKTTDELGSGRPMDIISVTRMDQ